MWYRCERSWRWRALQRAAAAGWSSAARTARPGRPHQNLQRSTSAWTHLKGHKAVDARQYKDTAGVKYCSFSIFRIFFSLTSQQQRHDEVGGDLDAAEVVRVGASLQAVDHLGQNLRNSGLGKLQLQRVWSVQSHNVTSLTHSFIPSSGAAAGAASLTALAQGGQDLQDHVSPLGVRSSLELEDQNLCDVLLSQSVTSRVCKHRRSRTLRESLHQGRNWGSDTIDALMTC